MKTKTAHSILLLSSISHVYTWEFTQLSKVKKSPNGRRKKTLSSNVLTESFILNFLAKTLISIPTFQVTKLLNTNRIITVLVDSSIRRIVYTHYTFPSVECSNCTLCLLYITASTNTHFTSRSYN